MANTLSVEEALDYILLPDGIESDLEDDDEWEDKMMKVDDDLDLNYNSDLDMNAGPLEVEADNLIDYEEDKDCTDLKKIKIVHIKVTKQSTSNKKSINGRKRYILFRTFPSKVIFHHHLVTYQYQ